MKLEKIISGGQTGVDQAALRAARRLGLATGGTAPRRFITLEGPKRELLIGFGLVEGSGGYAQRTEANVCEADATLRIAANYKSAGEKLTKLMTFRYNKPRFDVLFSEWVFNDDEMKFATAKSVKVWLERNKVRVLNVAGNSETTSPGIGEIAEEFLILSLQ